MRLKMMEIICCPLCKGELKLTIDNVNESIEDGKMVCAQCNNIYQIIDGIPRMYIDIEDIKVSNISNEFSEFVITPSNLERMIKDNKSIISPTFFRNNVAPWLLIGFGWSLLFVSLLVFVTGYYATYDMGKYFLLFALCLSLICFIIDYLSYIGRAKIEYLKNLYILKELSNEKRMVENEIRKFVKDDEEAYKDQFSSAKKRISRKGGKIASYIKEYNFKVNKALNVGCGGEPSQEASLPYFNAGYNMIGVDVSEEYLKYFSKTFKTDAVYANGLCLPFRDSVFELVNYTDILEHLTNPVLGLTEIHRVLAESGIIILSTPNRSGLKYRSINPFVLAGQLAGIYCESILPPRNILADWMDFQFYHTAFARRELITLMETTGFQILSIETQNISGYKIVNLLEYIPILKFLCNDFIVVGKKKGGI